MPLTKPTFAVNNVQSLATLVKGQATTIKALFDKTGADTKNYLITLCDQLDLDFATKIDLANALLGQIIDGSLTDAKLSNAAGQIKSRVGGATAPSNDLDNVVVSGLTFIDSLTLHTPGVGGSGSMCYTAVFNADAGEQLYLGRVINAIYYRRKSAGVWQPWVKILTADDLPVTGTYTGDGTASRTITLGFRPKSVLLTGDGGKMYVSPQGFGGLALDGNDCVLGSYPLISIVSTGFTVYYNNTNNQLTNSNGQKYLYKVDR